MPELSFRRLRVVEALVRAVVPIHSEFPELALPLQDRVVRDVCSYVGGQITGMPAYLRWPYQLAITAFDLLPLLRFGSRFVELDRKQRSSYLAVWSDAPIAVMRDFVKLVRSCALLAYFDHPMVRRQLAS